MIRGAAQDTAGPMNDERTQMRPFAGTAGVDQVGEKEEPQPQVVTALGLRMTNWAPSMSSL